MSLDIFAIWISQPGPALLWTSLGFLVGAIIGHYLALDRDRRKEFNEVADPLRLQLRRELTDIRANARWAEANAMSLIGDIVRPWKRARFRCAVADYEHARKEHMEVDSYGQPHYTRTDHIEKAIEKLLAKLKRW